MITDVLKRYKTNTLAIDSIGVSCGLVQDLENLGYTVIKVCGSERALQHERFINKRAELYFKLRDWFSNVGYVSIPDNRILQEELLTIEYSLDDKDKNRYRILPKKKDKSPDIADALSYTFAYDVPGKEEVLYKSRSIQKCYYKSCFKY
jgi:hypothetical protein